MKITIKNDGKGKAQSYEAELNEFSEGNYWGHWKLELSGYGANEFSAKESNKNR